MSVLAHNKRLLDLIDDARLLEDEPPPDGDAAQVQALIYAAELKRLVSQIHGNIVAALVAHRERGDMIETADGIVQIVESSGAKAWRNDDLRQDARPKILFDDNGTERTGSEVLDFLWDTETGLHPLNGGMRMKQFRALGFKVDEYADTTPTRTVRVLAEGNTDDDD